MNNTLKNLDKLAEVNERISNLYKNGSLEKILSVQQSISNLYQNVVDRNLSSYQRITDEFAFQEKQIASLTSSLNAIANLTQDIIPANNKMLDDNAKRAIFNFYENLPKVNQIVNVSIPAYYKTLCPEMYSFFQNYASKIDITPLLNITEQLCNPYIKIAEITSWYADNLLNQDCSLIVSNKVIDLFDNTYAAMCNECFIGQYEENKILLKRIKQIRDSVDNIKDEFSRDEILERITSIDDNQNTELLSDLHEFIDLVKKDKKKINYKKEAIKFCLTYLLGCGMDSCIASFGTYVWPKIKVVLLEIIDQCINK